MFDEVESRRKRLDGYKPFDENMLRRLNAVFEPFFIYNSNALEGNTLSLGDTIYLIHEGRLPGGKREEEYLEVKGQQAAYAYLQEAVLNGFEISEKLVRELHQLLTEKLDAKKFRPGQYKDRENQVRLPDGSLFPYVSHVETPAAMRDLIAWYRADGQALRPIERAAWLHYKFILIHPFRDGNGRTARMLANLALMQAGYSMAIFRADERRPVYLGALRAVDQSVSQDDLAPANPNLKMFPFVSYLEQELLWSYDQALDVVEGRTAVDTEDLVASFGRLETKALGARGIAPNEQGRLDQMVASVDQMKERVQKYLEPVVSATNSELKEWTLTLSADTQNASDALIRDMQRPSEAWFRRVALGLDQSPPRGNFGRVRLAFIKKQGRLIELETPDGYCEFLICAEPHAVVLAVVLVGISGADESWIDRDPSEWSARVRFPLDEGSWRSTDIKRFIVSQAQRFLIRAELHVERLNTPEA